jgi:putative nucleotidyltransferase with HDIG domain
VNSSLKLHVEKITKIPTLPVIAQEILALLDDDLVSLNKLKKVVENDPAISSRLLSIANSAYFGFGTPVTTLDNAIFRVGFDVVKNIAIGIAIMTVLEGDRHQTALHYERIFNHSVSVGFVSKLLSRRFKLTIADEVLICGLLHDIGLLILSRHFPEKYQEVLHAIDKDKALHEAEKEVFDFTHADVGFWLAEKWNLPDTVTDAILYHHTPSIAQNNLKHVAVVHIADYVTAQNIIKEIDRTYSQTMEHSSLDMLGISDDDLAGVMTETKNGSLFSGLFVEL